MPLLNNLDYTKKALKTINLSQPYALFLIDNGSVDGTGEFIKKLALGPNIFSLVLKQNLGAAGSWNSAIQFAFQNLNCEKVIILNNDILLLPQTLNLIVEALDFAKTGLVSAKNVAAEVADEKEFKNLLPPKTMKLTETPDFSCFGVNKECVKKVGLFDEVFYPAYFEDNDYHHRMRLEGLTAVCDHRAIYFHYGSRSRDLTPDFRAWLDKCYIKNESYYQKKWGGSPGKEKYKMPFDGNPPKKIELPELMTLRKGD